VRESGGQFGRECPCGVADAGPQGFDSDLDAGAVNLDAKIADIVQSVSKEPADHRRKPERCALLTLQIANSFFSQPNSRFLAITEAVADRDYFCHDQEHFQRPSDLRRSLAHRGERIHWRRSCFRADRKC
jgi:hypothetical protein